MIMLLLEISGVFGFDPEKPIVISQVMAFDEAEFAFGIGVRDVYSAAFRCLRKLLNAKNRTLRCNTVLKK